VSFKITIETIAYLDKNGTPILPLGNVLFSIGGGQPDDTTAKNKTTVEGTLTIIHN
jgi:hypothetical protein